MIFLKFIFKFRCWSSQIQRNIVLCYATCEVALSTILICQNLLVPQVPTTDLSILLFGVSNISFENLGHFCAYLIMLEMAGVYIRAKPRTFWQILLKSIFGLAIYSIQTPFPGGKNMGGLWSYFKVLHLSVVTTNTARYHLFDHFQRTF